jgi:hypothetical protein
VGQEDLTRMSLEKIVEYQIEVAAEVAADREGEIIIEEDLKFLMVQWTSMIKKQIRRSAEKTTINNLTNKSNKLSRT